MHWQNEERNKIARRHLVCTVTLRIVGLVLPRQAKALFELVCREEIGNRRAFPGGCKHCGEIGKAVVAVGPAKRRSIGAGWAILYDESSERKFIFVFSRLCGWAKHT